MKETKAINCYYS